MAVKPIPDGYHTLTPYLVVDGADEAMALYQRALGAEIVTVNRLHGKVINASLRIGNSLFMLNDEWPDFGAIGPNKIGGTAVTIHIYTEDADALFNQAVAAGFTVGMPIGDAPWGDRYGSLKDPYGHSWSIATHLEDVSDEEFNRRMAESPM